MIIVVKKRYYLVQTGTKENYSVTLWTGKKKKKTCMHSSLWNRVGIAMWYLYTVRTQSLPKQTFLQLHTYLYIEQEPSCMSLTAVYCPTRMCCYCNEIAVHVEGPRIPRTSSRAFRQTNWTLNWTRKVERNTVIYPQANAYWRARDTWSNTKSVCEILPFRSGRWLEMEPLVND